MPTGKNINNLLRDIIWLDSEKYFRIFPYKIAHTGFFVIRLTFFQPTAEKICLRSFFLSHGWVRKWSMGRINFF